MDFSFLFINPFCLMLCYQVSFGFCLHRNPKDHRYHNHRQNLLIDYSSLFSYLLPHLLSQVIWFQDHQYSLQIVFVQKSQVFVTPTTTVAIPCYQPYSPCLLYLGTNLHTVSTTSLSPIEYSLDIIQHQLMLNFIYTILASYKQNIVLQ